MRRVIINDTHYISPFNESARDLRVQNMPLWMLQRELLQPYTEEEREYRDWESAYESETDAVESLVHRDNLYFNDTLIAEFISRAREGKRPSRLALRLDDPAVAAHVYPLTHNFQQQNGLLLADMWYLPKGIAQSVAAEPLIIDLEARERGYYHVPSYMATDYGDLIFQLPRKRFLSIENWVHIFVADILFGAFSQGADVEDRIGYDWVFKLKVLARAIVQQKQVLATSELVQVGENCNIDPSAIIHGPTIIGDNVTIGAGAVIDNCIIGNNVTISQGCQLLLSVVSDYCFLPFRAALFMTTMMENSMVAQNTCLQLCVIGRDSFIGAGTTFTDFNVLGGPLRTFGRDNNLEQTHSLVLGGCVGHHCRLGSGMIIYAARTIESDVVLLSADRSHIMKNVPYEQSDHHEYALKYPYPRLYPRKDGT